MPKLALPKFIRWPPTERAGSVQQAGLPLPIGLLKRPAAGQRAALPSGSRTSRLQSNLASLFIPRCLPQRRKNRLGTFLLVMRSSSEKKEAPESSYAKYEASVRGAAEGLLNPPGGPPAAAAAPSYGRPCLSLLARGQILHQKRPRA